VTIQEAIKSGKRFRKVGQSFWCEPGQDYYFSPQGVLGEWEIDNVTKELTAEDIRHASAVVGYEQNSTFIPIKDLNILIKKLGLE